MKLLILTQKVDIDDDLLGFFHGWISEFAKNCEKVTVICLEKGEYQLPENVKVLSLGKEDKNLIFNFQLFKRLKYIFNFYCQIWMLRKDYHAVFVHMNFEYVVLGGLVWKLLGKRISLWYVHKKVSLSLKLAEKIANVIFSASRESFGVVSSKLKIVGHGLDFNKFSCADTSVRNNENFKIIYVGRISKIKNQKLLIEAINILVKKKLIDNVKVNFIGSPVYREDKKYQQELEDLIKNYELEKYFNFIGSVPYKDIDKIYKQANLSINLCPTGGMDKAVLESMAAGLPVIVYNKTFKILLDEYDNLILKNLDKDELADEIFKIMNLNQESLNLIIQNLRNKIFQEYNLASLISKIVSELSKFN